MKIEQLMRPNNQDEYGILKLQNIILNMMKDIDEICTRHNISYAIISGSALGAVRHGGFIPWDDDFDIAMPRDEYDRFLTVCKEELPSDIYYVQESCKDWSLYFSKIRLKKTQLKENTQEIEIDKDNCGIFIDVFPLDNGANLSFIRLWQYFCSKLLIAYGLRRRGIVQTGFIKKVMVFFSKPLQISWIHQFFYRQCVSPKETNTYADFFDIVRYKNVFIPKTQWGKPVYVPFETISLPVPEKTDTYLSSLYGNYMELPPKEQRKGTHYVEIDYGKY